MSCLWENAYDRTQYNSPSIEELLLTPQTAGLFHYHGPTTAEMLISSEWLACKIRSVTPVFCFPCKGEVHLAVSGKSSFTAHLRMVLASIAVCHRLALGCSVLWEAPRLLLHLGQVLPTRDAYAKPNQTKKIPVWRLCFVCFDKGIEKEKLS